MNDRNLTNFIGAEYTPSSVMNPRPIKAMCLNINPAALPEPLTASDDALKTATIDTKLRKK